MRLRQGGELEGPCVTTVLGYGEEEWITGAWLWRGG